MADGFDASPAPAIGADGMPVMSASANKSDPPPRLCEAGPCRNYHAFKIQLDAERPLSGGEVFHTEAHHYCYPAVGIETRLGSLPVLQCSRWSPLTADELRDHARVEDDYWSTHEGKKHKEVLEAWMAGRREE
jgi:hypothetical protein